MPKKFAFIGTVTFNSYLTYETKCELIKEFPKFMSSYLLHNNRSNYQLHYTVEYHKVDNEDDPEAPHIHYILYTNTVMSRLRWTSLVKALQQFYGRSQLILATERKLNHYRQYILKDVEKNKDVPAPYEHHVITTLTKELNPLGAHIDRYCPICKEPQIECDYKCYSLEDDTNFNKDFNYEDQDL